MKGCHPYAMLSELLSDAVRVYDAGRFVEHET